MHIFEYKGNTYLSIKDHNFHILNGFSFGYQNYVYLQCTTNTSSGIVKEYLPKGWELQKKRYNGQMIFTLYRKSYFNYKSKSKSLGTLCFLALSEEGAKYLLYRWILNEQLNLDDNEVNIEIVKDNIGNYAHTISGLVNDQKMFGVRLNINDNRHRFEWIESEIKEIVN